MQIHCRGCRTMIPADDINLQAMLAKCSSCHSVFDFSNQVRMEPPPAKVKRDRGEVAMPASFRVQQEGGTLIVEHRWPKGPAWFLLFFSAFWNVIVSVFVVAAAAGGFEDSPDGPGGAFIWLFLTPFILIGLGTAYLAVAFLLNRTTIGVQDGVLIVVHSPIPWPGGRRLPVAEIEQLYCEEYVAYQQNRVPQWRVALQARIRAGDRIRLVAGMEGPEQGVYLEQLLERHLGIQDRPVTGELES